MKIPLWRRILAGLFGVDIDALHRERQAWNDDVDQYIRELDA